jgi:hypothetical protein
VVDGVKVQSATPARKLRIIAAVLTVLNLVWALVLFTFWTLILGFAVASQDAAWTAPVVNAIGQIAVAVGVVWVAAARRLDFRQHWTDLLIAPVMSVVVALVSLAIVP